MVLADFGASVIRVDKLGSFSMDTMCRGKRSISIDLKRKGGQTTLRRLSSKSDVLIEPFRPGVMEKLGLGPDALLKDNPRLVYVRLSGFGQTGPYRMKAGHDINYIATSGVLSMLRRKGQNPTAPVNLVADFAGGGLVAAFGVLSALYEREKSGKGQVIDANMVEGSAYVSSFLFTQRNLFPNPPGENMLDTAAPFYDTFRTKDDKFVSVGAIESKFYLDFLKGLQLDPDKFGAQLDNDNWPKAKQAIAAKISQFTRAELTEMFKGLDACVMPVLERDEVAEDPHNRERGSFFTDDEGMHIPNPAPRLSRTPAKPHKGPKPQVGESTFNVLREYGFTNQEITELIAEKSIMDSSARSRL
uniref:Alpha-methylacyl-CoA racemase-like n=1 Tax=Phallusia mammillata TaxID=59560 RepID=A0A6F9D752_9ASCI|nr:alpha-methylacyl-CoA racemase-like [Phallusia mammillata]